MPQFYFQNARTMITSWVINTSFLACTIVNALFTLVNICDGNKTHLSLFREFQPTASIPDDNSFIIRPRHQSVFGIGRE